MKVSYIVFALIFVALAYSGANYYQVYLDTTQYLHEFDELDYPNNPELETDIQKKRVMSHDDTAATLLFARTNKEQYFVVYKREGATDILKRFGDWELTEVEKVRNSDGSYNRYYFPIYF